MKIISHTSHEDKEWSSICIRSQREFAEKHNIPYILYENLSLSGRSAKWARFRAMQGEITASAVGEAIVWMDSDLLIMNPEFDLVGMCKEFEQSTDLAGCFLVMGTKLDLSLCFIKNIHGARELFDFGWDVGKTEGQGNRRDRLSVDLMCMLAPNLFQTIIAERILSQWYPSSPKHLFDHKIDSQDGKVGLFTMKKPPEMVEGFPDIFVPGTFSVHLNSKGPALLKTSEEFLHYRDRMMKSVEESRLLIKDLI